MRCMPLADYDELCVYICCVYYARIYATYAILYMLHVDLIGTA